MIGSDASSAGKRRKLLLVAAVALATLASSSFFLIHNFSYESVLSAVEDSMFRPHRLLRLGQFDDDPHAILPKTINVYITQPKDFIRVNDDILLPNGQMLHSLSIFRTNIFLRYGSGRFGFHIHELQTCDCDPEDISREKAIVGEAPCLVVTTVGGRSACQASELQCMYTHCKTMIVGDEQCRHNETDVREYQTSDMPTKSYLPLGPRLDSWRSLQHITQDTKFSFKSAASQRKYAFNAIFSQETNAGRKQLAKIINEHEGAAESNSSSEKMSSYVAIATKFDKSPNRVNSEQLDTLHYMDTLLDSVFTLAPAGHNPESFRLFEAVEAGSIPILVKDDVYTDADLRKDGTTNSCKGALHDWQNAPIVILESWAELYPTVEELMSDLTKLNDMQVKLRIWYDEYMRKVVSDFEDFMMMESNTGTVAGD